MKVGQSRPLAVSPRHLPTEETMQIEAARGGWTVRPWRQVELGDLMRIYERQMEGTHVGSVVRSESYWRWIVGMRMAQCGLGRLPCDHVKGYAFVKDHHVLEIGSDEDSQEVFKMLLGRIRAESLERAYPEILLDVPSDHPVLSHLADWPAVGRPGRSIGPDQPNCLMMRLTNIGMFLNQIAPELDRRVRAAGQNAGELGLSIVSHRGPCGGTTNCRCRSNQAAAPQVDHAQRQIPDSARLGQESIESLVLSGSAHFQNASAAVACDLLFPRRSLWRSTMDRFTY